MVAPLKLVDKHAVMSGLGLDHKMSSWCLVLRH